MKRRGRSRSATGGDGGRIEVEGGCAGREGEGVDGGRSSPHGRRGRRPRGRELSQGSGAAGHGPGAERDPGRGEPMARARARRGTEPRRRGKAPGPRPRLTPQQRAQIPEPLEHNAEARGFRGGVGVFSRYRLASPKAWSAMPPMSSNLRSWALRTGMSSNRWSWT
jgi:hypothetical protein